MKRKPSKTKFPYLLWHYTTATENLFTLSREELFIFKLLVNEATK
jgi:hypothetical protein